MRIQTRSLVVLAAVAALAILAASGDALANNEADVTYYRDVLPIIQDNCQTCHRDDGLNLGGVIAPMSFMSYDTTRPWARAIARKVEAREMPPWFATGPTDVFSNERGLTDEEIGTLVRWVEAGAPAGETADAPTPHQFVENTSGGWSLGTPDFVFQLEEPYFVDDDVYDLNISFFQTLTEADLPDDVWVRGWEFKTGAGSVTHHMCGFVRGPDPDVDPGEAAQKGAAGSGQLLTCIAEGAEAVMLPDGYGLHLEAGSTLTYNMHYHKRPGEGSGVWTQPEIAFFVESRPVTHQVTNDAIGNTGFELPPGVDTYRIGASRTLEQDTHVLTYWPHGHLRTKAARYTATYPDGREELLLDVPAYDQGWQETYKLKQPKLLPKGTRIDVSQWYDNSPERAARYDFDPDLTPGHGPRTDDEMALGFIGYAVEIDPDSTEDEN
jgi:mono/diheme cytochrome c family protein